MTDFQMEELKDRERREEKTAELDREALKTELLSSKEGDSATDNRYGESVAPASQPDGEAPIALPDAGKLPADLKAAIATLRQAGADSGNSADLSRIPPLNRSFDAICTECNESMEQLEVDRWKEQL